MRILVTGATGFIGSYIAKALVSAGHDVIGGVRNPSLGQSLNPAIQYIHYDFAEDVPANVWLDRLQGIDVVINVVGIITESNNNTFNAVHVRGPIALFDACVAAKVKKIIHISALGVSADANTDYNNTKLIAELHLATLTIPYIILRPSWLIGERSQSFELLNAVSALPIIPIVDKGNYLVQPISVVDFAQGVTLLLYRNECDGMIISIGGPEKISIRDIHTQLRNWQGLTRTRILAVPKWLVRQVVKLGDLIFKGPINRASFDMLTRHNVTDDSRFWDVTGIQPISLKKMLNDRPCSKPEKTYFRLFFLLPLLRYSLAIVWLMTAVITAFFTPKSINHLLTQQIRLTGQEAIFAVYGFSLIDFLLGLTLLFSYRLKLFGTIQFLLVVFYTIFISVQAPQWWLHPYGPLLKNIPILIGTLIIISLARK